MQARAPFETPSYTLNNGEFTWTPEIAPTGPIAVLVSLDEATSCGVEQVLAHISTLWISAPRNVLCKPCMSCTVDELSQEPHKKIYPT